MEFINEYIKLFTTWLNNISGNNQFLAATLFGTLAFLLRSIPLTIFNIIKRQLFISINLTDNGINGAPITYAQILSWHKNSKWSKFSRTITLVDNPKSPNDRLISGYGKHFLIYGGSLFWIFSSSRDLDNGELKTLSIQTFIWNRKKITSMLLNIHNVDYSLPCIYDLGWKLGTEYALFVTYRIPKFYSTQTQFIDDDIYMEMDKRLNRFVNNPEYYNDSSLTYKETFLLYGEPGTGKTNLIRHFASKYNMSIICVSDGEQIKQVQQLLVNMSNVIILIEDIDTISGFTISPDENDQHAWNNQGKVHTGTSTILNYLDGVSPLSNCILVMSTNHIEKIVPSLYRPGRVDLLLNMTYPSTIDLINKLDWDDNDVRKNHMFKYLGSHIPMANYVTLRNAETVEEIDKIMLQSSEYFTLQQASGVEYYIKDKDS